MVVRFLEHQFFRLPDRVENERLPVVAPVSTDAKANLARVGVLVERLCKSNDGGRVSYETQSCYLREPLTPSVLVEVFVTQLAFTDRADSLLTRMVKLVVPPVKQAPQGVQRCHTLAEAEGTRTHD